MTCIKLRHRFFHKNNQNADAMGSTSSIFCCFNLQIKCDFLKFFKIKKKLKVTTNNLCLSRTTDLSPASDVHLINEINTEYNHSDEFRYLNGRRYHNTIKSRYCLSNDSTAQNRIREFHETTKMFWGSNFSSPIEETLRAGGVRVLDIGCGPGAWMLDLCQTYPNCHFTGIDISDIFPCETRPENVSFTKANVLDGLPFAAETFDFIHMRYMIHAFSKEEWGLAIDEAVRLLKPGGYLEICELDIIIQGEGPITKCAIDTLTQYYHSRGIETVISDSIENMLTSTRKISRIIKSSVFAPIGTWGGTIGIRMADTTLKFFQNYRKCFSDTMGVELQEYDSLIELWPREMEEYHCSNQVYRWCAQKAIE